MKRIVSGMMLTLLIASVAFLTFDIQPAKSLDSSAYAEQVSLNEEGKDSQARIVEHRITASELEKMKREIGVCENARNYNQIINGHGTGLRPPTEEEWAQIAANVNIVETVSLESTSQPPSSVDYSTSPWFPPIGDQDGESSCVAWALGYYMKTFQEAKEHGWNLTNARWEGAYPTPEYQDKIISPAFIYHLINWGVNSWTYSNVAIGLICDIGACSWAKMPWNSSDQATWPSESAWREAAYYRGTGGESLSVNTEEGILSLKNWIASGNLAEIAVNAFQYSSLTSDDVWTVDNYAGGTNHANTIVGYDDNFTYLEGGELSKGAFKIANSWGVGSTGSSRWENVPDGFYWISYKAMSQKVGYVMFYRDRIGYVPTLTSSFRIEHPLRGECNIEIGMGTHDNPKASKSFTWYIFGGDQPFCSNNIVFDITEFRDVVPSVGGQPFFMKVYDRGTSATGTILYFAIENTVSPDPPVATIDGGYVFADLVTPIESTLAVRGLDDRIYYRTGEGTGWEGWMVLPGSTIDSPAAAMLGNELHIVVRGSNGNSLWHGYLTNASDPESFSGWNLLSGATQSTPTLTSNGTALCLVVRGLDNRVYYRYYTDSWGDWQSVPTGATLDSPAAAMLGNDLHIAVRGMDGSSLWDVIISCDGTVVRDWTLLSGATPSKPVFACSSSDSLCLVVRGMDNAIYYRGYTGLNDSWTDWSAVPTGATIDGPAATVMGNMLCTVVRGSDGSSLWCGEIDLDTSSFTGWTLLSGATPSAPTLTS